MSYQQQYSQLDGYKHMLQVAENILYSSQIDEQILQKYQQLKSSIHKKMTPLSNNNYINKQKQYQQPDTFHINLLSTYRLMIDNVIKTVQAFQQELENDMQRQGYNRVVNQVNGRFNCKVQQLQAIIEINSSNTFGNTNTNTNNNTSTTNYTNKTKLLHRQQINTIRYQHQQLDSKFQNLGLLIEVHKKMHQIILQATRAEQKKSSNQDRLKDRIKQLQEKLNEVGDVKMFIQQHKLTESNYGEFVAASKALKKILFANYQFR